MSTFGPTFVRSLDAERLLTQLEVLRDAMLSAWECEETWLTLEELHKLTGYPTPSISADFRHLQRPEHGGYIGMKRRRESTGMKSGIWEYALKKAEIKARTLFG